MTNLHQLIYALSDALDLVGVDDLNHGKRVAYMAMECAKALQWPHDDIIKIMHAGLLHDCGVASTKIHEKLVTTLDWAGADDHCIRGYQLLSLSKRLRHLSNIVLYHHTHFDTLETLDIDHKTKMMTNLIFMVDRVDAVTLQYKTRMPDVPVLGLVKKIRQDIMELSGLFFNPELVEVFLKVSEKEVFWFTLEEDNLHRYFHEYIDSLESDPVSLESLSHIAELFAHLVDAKSPYTGDHSLDVAKLSHYIATKMGLPDDVCEKIEIAGLLHDLGKLRVPDELLDKDGPLTENEYGVIKIHAYATHQILSQINGLEEITEWASQHHEKLNGKGYPYHTDDARISLPARIIAVADVFQALAQKRPYREDLKPMEIMSIVQEKAESEELDKEVVQTVRDNLQECWQISVTHSHKLMA